MFKLAALFLALVALAQATDISYIQARLDPGKECPSGPPSTAGIRCQRTDCSFSYYLRAYWKTTVYGPSNLQPCLRACDRHQASCKVQCETFADQNVFESSNICHCTRRASKKQVVEDCFNACKTGKGMCTGMCFQPKKCRRSLTTFGTFLKEYRGFCGVKCNTLSITAERP